MGKASPDKGGRAEREIVSRHSLIGIHAERVPLSGASRYQGNGADIDVYAFGKDAPPLVGEVKARKRSTRPDGKDTGGFKLIERWLGDGDILFLRRDRALPLVVLPWETWEKLLAKKLPGFARTRQTAPRPSC